MLDDTALATLFRDARTHTAWRAQEVTDAQLRMLYELCKWGPTSANSSPLRISFVRSPAAKERLLACMAPGNLEKTRTAPVSAILGMDLAFYEKLPQLFPQVDARAWFVGNAELAETTAMRNASLQAGYFMLAARAIGLDCGPMSGFDAARLDAEFFAGTTIRTNFVCNLGYGDTSALHPRLPRLSFEEACTVL